MISPPTPPHIIHGTSSTKQHLLLAINNERDQLPPTPRPPHPPPHIIHGTSCPPNPPHIIHATSATKQHHLLLAINNERDYPPTPTPPHIIHATSVTRPHHLLFAIIIVYVEKCNTSTSPRVRVTNKNNKLDSQINECRSQTTSCAVKAMKIQLSFQANNAGLNPKNLKIGDEKQKQEILTRMVCGNQRS